MRGCAICGRAGHPPSICADDFYREVERRDDARSAARELLELLQGSEADLDDDERLFVQWPWLRPAEEQ